MNEQLQKELAAWLGKLREGLDAGASFAIEQAPLIVQEQLLYGRITHTVLMIAAILVVVIGLSGVRRLLKDADDQIGWATLWSGGLGTLLALCGADIIVGGFVKVWFAPRIYILEWLSGLLK